MTSKRIRRNVLLARLASARAREEAPPVEDLGLWKKGRGVLAAVLMEVGREQENAPSGLSERAM